ncbi:MAG: DUF192 domain-containing protein [Rhodobacteraceae bacterium]|nr:DUF192 domain-containing protein [Paracoccaceae bacterium]
MSVPCNVGAGYISKSRNRAGLCASAVLCAFVASSAAAECRPDRITVAGDWGHASFTIELADEPSERAQGLMHVEQMPLMQGMLFVYETPQHATFWMRNTLIPLDMLFADATGRITVVHPNAIPLDESIVDGGEGVLFVLEINGGMAQRLGIEPGDLLAHPSIGEEAELSCDD